MNLTAIKNDALIIADSIKTNIKKTNWLLIGAGAAALLVFSNAAPSHAQANGNEDYIEELKTKSEGIDDVGNNVYLVAAGTTAFAAGSKILKRVLYA